MKAAVFEKYGPPEVLRLKEIQKPVPKDNEILVRVVATTVAAGDVKMRKAHPFAVRFISGLIRPKRVTIPGFELAGQVEEAGKGVKRFKPGDKVFAFAGFGFGACTEYKCMEVDSKPENGMVEPMPSNMTYEQAAAIPVGGLTAHVFIRRAGMQKGQKALVYGASGSVGSYAVQLAKHCGAEVTGVTSAANLEMVKSLGADHVIDYKKEDFTQSGQVYDVIFDAVGKTSPSRTKKTLKEGGRFFSVMKLGKLERGDLLRIKEFAEAGVIKPYIDRTYPIEDIVEAHRYANTGHKRANVVITI